MKHYVIQHNYRRRYIVVVSDKETLINVVVYNFQLDKLCYEIVDVKPIGIMLGNSCDNDMTQFSGARNDECWNANTNLLQLEENKYMFIGEQIYTFTTQGDKIIKYISNMGNNFCSYPIAYGEKNIYLLAKEENLSHDKITDKEILKRIKEMDESFEPYNGLENGLYEWDDVENVNLYISSENKFENEKMNIETIHKPFDDFILWYNHGEDSYGNDMIGVLKKSFQKGKKQIDQS